MAVIDLSIHPFQRNDLEHNADWQGLEFWSGDEGYLIERTAALNAAFQEAVAEGRLWPFLRTYTQLSKEMLSQAGDIPLMAPILRDALHPAHQLLWLSPASHAKSIVSVSLSSFVAT